MLLTVCERLEYTVLLPESAHASLDGLEDRVKLSIIEARENLHTTEGLAAAGVELNSMDLVHVRCWGGDSSTTIPQLLDACYHAVRPGGTVVAWSFANAGVYAQRGQLRAAVQGSGLPPLPEEQLQTWLSEKKSSFLAGRNNMTVGAEPPADVLQALQETVRPAALPAGWRSWMSAKFLLQSADSGAVATPLVWREQVDSQLDMTRSVDDPTDSFGQSVLSEVWGVNSMSLALQRPQVYDEMLGDLAESTLYPAGNAAPVLVHAPLLAVQIMKPPSVEEVQAAGADCLVLPLLPVDPFQAAAAGGPTPAQNAQGMVRYLELNPDVAEFPHENVKAAPVRGSFGHFLGTGAGPIPGSRAVAQTFAAADDKPVTAPRADADASGHPGVHVPEPSSSSVPKAPGIWLADTIEDDRQLRALLATRNPWLPLGPRGSFFNVGLANWHALRESWTACSPDAVPPVPPPPVDVDAVYEELAILRRSYTLPGPMPLRDVVHLLVELWDEEQYYR